jgi:membrane-associated phospholipid phosphatase
MNSDSAARSHTLPQSGHCVPKRLLKSLLAHYTSMDVINSVFFMLLAVFTLIYHRDVPGWGLFLLSNAAVIGAIAVLARFAARRGHIWNLLHGFYMMLCIPIAFKQMYFLVPAINPTDYDTALIAIDRFLFASDPTHVLMVIAHPVLTELLQLAYASFYLLPLILAVDLYRMMRMKAFKTVFMMVILGFYLSYLGYVAVPAIGPRFTLHDFDTKDVELPGLLLTKALRAYTNAGESIPTGTADPASVVQRDVFPSGHTQITLLVMMLAFRYRARSRWFLLVTGSLLILATVYLRYHYVIDLIGGALFAIFTLQLGRVIDNWWTSRRKRFARQSMEWQARLHGK